MLKTVSSITNAIGALNYKGTWNANTNTPTLASGVGTKGDYYVVSVAGTTSLDGISNWGVGDWVTFNGTVWQRVEGGADLNGVNLSVSGISTLDGNATFKDNLTQGTAAKGMNFTANTASTGSTSQLLSYYEEVTAASTACTGAITTAVVWKAVRVGNVVTLTLPTTTGTAVVSPGLSFQYGVSLPTAFRPSASLGFPCAIKDNDTNLDVPGVILVSSTGTITVYKNLATSSNFTAGNTAGLGQGVGIALSWTI